MGMYTELNLGIRLKTETPEEVIDVIKFMANRYEEDTFNVKTLPPHPLFSTSRWAIMLRCDSYYFDSLPHVSFEYDDIADCWFLTCVSNLKNYSNEIEHFLDWIAPHVDTEGFAGYRRYEENYHPSLIYFNRGKVSYISIGETQ